MSWLRPAGRLCGRRGGPPHSSRVQVAAAAAPAVQTAPAQVLSVQQISRQNVPPQPGSQPDTQAEPDIAVDPNDPSVVVAVFQQGRFADGGSVDPGFAWSHDGGRTWRDGALPNLATAVGGEFPRASDPVVAFGPDHAVYVQTLGIDIEDCRSAVVVQRSDDGGRSFGDPVPVQDETDCNVLNDKNWITVDTFPQSPTTAAAIRSGPGTTRSVGPPCCAIRTTGAGPGHRAGVGAAGVRADLPQLVDQMTRTSGPWRGHLPRWRRQMPAGKVEWRSPTAQQPPPEIPTVAWVLTSGSASRAGLVTTTSLARSRVAAGSPGRRCGPSAR
jgi:hypothetical protein